MAFKPPPVWSLEELEAGRQTALADFIQVRTSEDPHRYVEAFRSREGLVRELFEATDDLRDIRPEAFGSKAAVAAARFLAGPHISEDDLATLVGASVTGKGKLSAVAATRVAAIIAATKDPLRYPWLDEGRAPTAAEREGAVRWTAGVWAAEATRTQRRTLERQRQESAVKSALEAAAYAHGGVPAGDKTIERVADVPSGSYFDELNLAGKKCDVPVGMRDGRLLAIECKASNSAVNSFKRLNHETGSKATAWKRAFGENGVVTAAVLAGVFRLNNLAAAQEAGITIFWEHSLDALKEFVAEA